MPYNVTLSYLTSPQLDRVLDTDKLINDALVKVVNDPLFLKLQTADPGKTSFYLYATITIAFPDPLLLVNPRIGLKWRQEVLEGMQKKVASAWYAMIPRVKSFFKLSTDGEELKHRIDISHKSLPDQDDGDLLREAMTISVTLWELRDVHILELALKHALSPPQFQLAKDISLKIEVEGEIDWSTHTGTLFEASASRKSIPHWLTLSKKDEVVKFLSVPAVGANIAAACAGFLVTADKALDGKEPQKRRNIDEQPITVELPGDPARLATEQEFLAFYPSIERQDGSVGRLVIDLDVQHGMAAVLRPDRAWKVACSVSDAIVACGLELGFPMPSRHFSGSRGIHVIWNVEQGALELNPKTQEMACEQYISDVRTAWHAAGKTTSTKYMTGSVTKAAKFLVQGLCLHAMHTTMQKAAFEDGVCAVLGARHPHQVCTLSKYDPASFVKIVLDTQTGVYRWLSPHLKSGLVCRPISDVTGSIKEKYRNLERVREDSMLDRVVTAITSDPAAFDDHPGTVTIDTIEAAFEPGALGTEIALLISKGIINASNLSPGEYAQSHKYMMELLEKEKRMQES